MQYRIAEVIMGMGERNGGVEIKAKWKSRTITQIQSYVLVIPLLTPTKKWELKVGYQIETQFEKLTNIFGKTQKGITYKCSL